MKARIKFTKAGSMRFIGHLDVMRYFQKAMRRADINVSYSQGFSPHQLMSFTSPLGIGLSSDAEYLDITLEETDAPQVMADRINAVMNDEIRIKGFTYLKDSAKPSMAALVACDYIIAVKPGKNSPFEEEAFIKEKICSFMLQDRIEVLKKTKKSEKLIDIKQGIYNMAGSLQDFEKITGMAFKENGELCLDEECTPVFCCRLASGSVSNIKPGLVLEELCHFAGVVYDEYVYQVHRLEMYAETGGKLVPMMEYDAVQL
ncbi:MAG: DUF2344 domain-containing protein [Lachnospiraceae bacterium]|nr:DUF2344 domain-containing protein [Lachnospiraceae bacterium]